MRLTTEQRLRVYDDDHGYYWEVRPDADGLGIEVVYNEGGKGDEDQPLSTIPIVAAELIADAIKRVASFPSGSGDGVGRQGGENA